MPAFTICISIGAYLLNLRNRLNFWKLVVPCRILEAQSRILAWLNPAANVAWYFRPNSSLKRRLVDRAWGYLSKRKLLPIKKKIDSYQKKKH